MSIGTFRKTVSGLIPKMTRVAWAMNQEDIEKSQPGITRAKFLYNLSRADYEKTWGTTYRHPGLGSRALALVLRIVPKIGPLRTLQFRTPTPEAEKLFMDSFNATLNRYRSLLAAERTRRTQPADVNLDVGEPTKAGTYALADEAYAKLVEEWAKHGFSGIPLALRENILTFYKDQNIAMPAKLHQELEMLRVATASSSR